MYVLQWSVPLLSPRNFLKVPPDLNRVTLNFRKCERVSGEEEGGGDEGALSSRSYEMTHTRYRDISLKEELTYSQQPDKEFKFYLGTLLLLFIIIYTVQAIMVYR